MIARLAIAGAFVAAVSSCSGLVVPKNHWTDFNGFTKDKPVFVDTDEGVIYFTGRLPLTITRTSGGKIISRFRRIAVGKGTFIGRTWDGEELRVPLAQIASIEAEGKVLGEVGAIVEKKDQQRRGLGGRQYGGGSF